ncbi:hypothetical protein E2C01_078190 [Portunus trituberculatus]|uniref:Uncharacterized protein n=1 Tax=Portunus trituberculatus TaxID=210409 RepID=A0A5B7IS21_PORTR|nr:hypothetical protein [Portunus trituberculatus]
MGYGPKANHSFFHHQFTSIPSTLDTPHGSSHDLQFTPLKTPYQVSLTTSLSTSYQLLSVSVSNQYTSQHSEKHIKQVKITNKSRSTEYVAVFPGHKREREQVTCGE